MIRAVIIEDEENSRELLRQMLEEYCQDVQVAGFGVDVPSGIALIDQIQPDVVFLDVEMPGGDGFSVLDAFTEPSFKVVFVTGYDHYAIKAIKYAALDYLLKPIHLDELIETVEKVKKESSYHQDNIRFLKEQVRKPADEINQIMLYGNKEHTVIKIEDVLFVEAERSYVTFHLTERQKYIASKPLTYYEELLPESSFFRIHKSYLVNGKKVIRLDSGRSGAVHLIEGVVLPVATRRKPAFLRFLDHIA